MRLRSETSKGCGGARYLPYAFTEQGVAMLSGILNSDKAISIKDHPGKSYRKSLPEMFTKAGTARK